MYQKNIIETCFQKSSEYLQLQNKCNRVSEPSLQKQHNGEKSFLNLLRIKSIRIL